jgi:hypothetical protein
LFICTTDYVGAEFGYELMILVKHRKEANFTRPNPPKQEAAVKTKAKVDGPQAKSTAESTQAIDAVQRPGSTSTTKSRIITKTTKARFLLSFLVTARWESRASWRPGKVWWNWLEASRDVIGLPTWKTQPNTTRDSARVAANVLTGHWGNSTRPSWPIPS